MGSRSCIKTTIIIFGAIVAFVGSAVLVKFWTGDPVELIFILVTTNSLVVLMLGDIAYDIN